MLVKDFFEILKNKIVQIVILAIIVVAVIYNLFFRYEYKIYNITSSPYQYASKIVKLDKLKGKAVTRICLPADKNNPQKAVCFD